MTLKIILEKSKKTNTSIDNDTILFWCFQMLKAVEFLHDKKIIHRHINPSLV